MKQVLQLIGMLLLVSGCASSQPRVSSVNKSHAISIGRASGVVTECSASYVTGRDFCTRYVSITITLDTPEKFEHRLLELHVEGTSVSAAYFETLEKGMIVDLDLTDSALFEDTDGSISATNAKVSRRENSAVHTPPRTMSPAR